MTNRFMISVAATALIAATGFAHAQGTGMSREAPSAGGSTMQQSAPSSGNSAAPSNRDAVEPTGRSSGMKATQSEEKMPQGSSQRAQDSTKSGMKGEKSAQDSDMKGEKSKSMSSENDSAKGNKEMRSEGGRSGSMNAEQKGAADKSQTTTGQAGAGAKLSTEQRTKISTVIREQRVQPLANVNFSIAVGTRVPRDVRFHPLPREVVTIYPEWREYEFVLVSNQIVVVDPRTFEIVAILDA